MKQNHDPAQHVLCPHTSLSKSQCSVSVGSMSVEPPLQTEIFAEKIHAWTEHVQIFFLSLFSRSKDLFCSEFCVCDAGSRRQCQIPCNWS